MSDRRKKKSAWVCTDPIRQRYYRRVGDFDCAFVEIRECGDGFSVSHELVSLDTMKLDEIESYCSGRYASLDKLIADHGVRNSIPLICECVFEQLGADDMEFNIPADTREEAVEKLREFIDGKSPLAKYYDYDNFGYGRA